MFSEHRREERRGDHEERRGEGEERRGGQRVRRGEGEKRRCTHSNISISLARIMNY